MLSAGFTFQKSSFPALLCCADGKEAAAEEFALGQYGPVNSLSPRLNEIYLRLL